ncbi:MAG: YfcE family phosphodiesterase [Pirellulales bacterium]
MLLGVVSDTHGQVDYALEAVQMLESFEVDVVLHCGDVGSTAVVKLFKPWPTHFVVGNVDHAATIRRAVKDAGQTFHNRYGELTLAGVKIALLHGDDAKKFDETVASQEFDLVCYGHTHVPKQQRRGRTLVLNPGALYRATPHTLAIVTLPELSVESIRV